MREHIQSTKSKDDFVDVIINHLTGSAKSEVKLRPVQERQTGKQILDIVRPSYGYKGLPYCTKYMPYNNLDFMYIFSFQEFALKKFRKILVNDSTNTHYQVLLCFAAMFCIPLACALKSSHIANFL